MAAKGDTGMAEGFLERSTIFEDRDGWDRMWGWGGGGLGVGECD